MPDISWTIGTDPDGDVVADSMEAPVPTWTRGSTVDMTFRFRGSGAQTRHRTLREYLDLAGVAITNQGLDGTTYYREPQADAESLLLSIRPSQDLQNNGINGIWGVLVDGEDVSRQPQYINPRLQFSVFVLAEYSEFASRSDVQNAREV